MSAPYIMNPRGTTRRVTTYLSEGAVLARCKRVHAIGRDDIAWGYDDFAAYTRLEGVPPAQLFHMAAECFNQAEAATIHSLA